MDSAAKINTLMQGLRMKYASNPTGLFQLWEQVFAGSTEFVEITGSAHEGGSDSGVQVLERLEYLKAVQEVLAEIDPTRVPSAPPTSTFADYRAGFIQT